ncbi:hypothetical protein [Lysobacter gummosus]|uniref:Secreted protein n=1 Tax=Lysobacter gummosus TaxID=262324 RepID=A0ABY3XJE2_9GAMM|nr:hypothetical protein [Lysobacter gummosus]ALN91361.1 hypothetical protein LG3211_2394 [Lysobacter gummosus]UNP31744.1 hypothetical protein MOV92_11050 [Lysobacter gummosus]
MDYVMRAAGAKLLVIAAALGLGLLAAPQAHAAGQCKTVNFFPGVVQVYATVKADANAGDSVLCNASVACPAGSRQVEVFGGGLSSSPAAVVAVESTARLSGGEDITANCETTAVGTRNGVTASTCNNKIAAAADKGTASSAQCTVYVDAPAGASVGANATCFCGT